MSAKDTDLPSHFRILCVSLQKTWPNAVSLQCWPHIARKVAEGEYWKTTWEHHAEAGEHIRAIHLSQSVEMMWMLIEQAGAIWDSWGGGTMNTFWNSHCVEPWVNWTMASCIDVPLCSPSQNTQESWHNNLLIGKIPQMFGGSTEHVYLFVKAIVLFLTAWHASASKVTGAARMFWLSTTSSAISM